MKRAGRQALERSHFLTSTFANETSPPNSATASRPTLNVTPGGGYRTALLFDSPTEGVRYAGGQDCGSERGRCDSRRYRETPRRPRWLPPSVLTLTAGSRPRDGKRGPGPWAGPRHSISRPDEV